MLCVDMFNDSKKEHGMDNQLLSAIIFSTTKFTSSSNSTTFTKKPNSIISKTASKSSWYRYSS